MSEATSQSGRLRGAETQRLLFWAVILITFFISIPLRRHGAPPDVSWLLTMCERILDGERAYVDIFETTPPVPMLLYMPGVILARLTGITPEMVTFAFAYAAAGVSLALSARILPDYVTGRGNRWLVLLAAAVVLFVLPNDAFAQREYFAAIFALPMFSVFVRHAREDAWPPLWDRILAAILAGLTIAIKPPLFAIPGIFLAVYYWSYTRRLSFLVSSGLLAAGVIGLAVTAASLAAFPEYLGDIMTVVREIYAPVRLTPLAFLGDKACLGVLLCLGLVLILSVGQKAPVTAVLMLMAGLGFLAAYFVQGKFFPYHVFPAVLFVVIAACILIYERLLSFVAGPSLRFAAVAGIYALAGFAISGLLIVGLDNGKPPMSDVSWAEGLYRPRALAISPDLSAGFPLARRIGAVWVDRIHSQWVARYTRYALQAGDLSELETAKFSRYHKQDLEWILRQIEEKAPDIIIQDISPGDAWLSSELVAVKPTFLEGYEIIAEEGGVRVLSRRSEAGRKSPTQPVSNAAHEIGPSMQR